MENCDGRRDRRISTKTTGDCYLRWSTARISGELAEKVTVSRRCPAFLRHPRSSCSGNMMLRALPPLRRLECASHSQCFGDTRQASTTWTWSDLTKKRDFIWWFDLICHLAHLRLPSLVLIDGGDIQSKFWSSVTNQMDAFLKWRRHQVFIERSFTVTVTFFCQQLPSCTLGEEWRRNVIFTFEQFPFFSRDCKGMKDCRCFQSDWGLCWKTVIYQWSVQPLVRKDIFFLSMVRLEDCLWKVRWSTLHRK